MSYWDTTSDFMSFPNMLDVLKIDDTNFLTLSSVLSEIKHVYSDSIITNFNFSDLNLLNSSEYDNFNMFSFMSLDSMIENSKLKNDVDELVKVFPSLEDDIEILDLWTRFGEEYLQEVESTPDVKLYYPEPFIASPSFVHEELWFIHILHYNHWLWFMFISLIMFYFITFINVVRWCNLRNKPKRETRGVSRSKCADLITACVPVSWAASIIISETVDATDYYDGFGTGEIVIGIRAYQWGWEYFYPKSIDLNYNVKPSYSTMVGNSLKYNNSSADNIEANSFWKSYQGKNLQNISVSPSHILLSPSDDANMVNISDFSKIGLSSLKDSSAFKKIQYHSKSPASQLFDVTTSSYSNFDTLAKLYSNTNTLLETKDYYTDRQNNYSSLASSQLNTKSNLDNLAVNKFLNFNFGVSADSYSPTFSNHKVNNTESTYFKDVNNAARINYSLTSHSDESNKVNKLVGINKTSLNINNTTDGKYSNNPVKAALNPTNLRKASVQATLVDYSDLSTDISSSEVVSNFSNVDQTTQFKDLKSPNMGFLSPDKNTRLISKLHSSRGQFNFSDESSNLSDVLNKFSNKTPSVSESEIYNSSNVDWVSPVLLNKSAALNLDNSSLNSPVYSNNPKWIDRSFNKFESVNDDQNPRLMKSKEETAPSHLFSEYWQTVWSNTSSTNRLQNNKLSSLFRSNFYLPLIEEYAEYDFKNWQALEALEDCFWESTFSSFTQDEYINSLNNQVNASVLKRQEELYSSSTRGYKFKNSKLYKPLKIDSDLNSLSLFSKEGFINSPLVSSKNFISVYNEASLDSIEDSYESIKNFSTSLNYANKSLLGNNLYSISPYSYTKVLDPFRADYEDQLWSYDNSSSNLNEAVSDFSASRVSNPMRLRSTTRNAIVSYNAMQKVFKSRLDEGRSHARLADFSNSFVSHNFITAPKGKYEGALSKNRNSFFDVNLYVPSNNENFSLLSSVYNSLNSTLIDIPFLISAKSDPSRYLWFDWQSRWSSIEVQPSSSARYSLSGVPYFSKSLEFDTQASDVLNESENYLNRLARARKNYLANWAYSPFFYARSSNWKIDLPHTSNSSYGTSEVKALLNSSSAFWSDVNITGCLSTTYNSSNSGTSTPTRSSWRPLNSSSGLVYDISTFIDILSKREHFYRTYINSFGLVANLPSHLSASPTNPLLSEISKGYGYIEPSSFSSELTREVMYSDLNFVKLNLMIDIYKNLAAIVSQTGINTNFVNTYLFKYLLGNDNANNLGNNQQLFKDQYRPMKKGVTNMVRLQATGAIAMPIEIRLHILASSRDVIHSWAIPSAGIKIDCVPGYSSHRITIFLVSGVFWGQCMEICGRFHHWMPIIVYFMKRDMFFLWCTHFMHYSTDLGLFDMTDRQLSSKLRVASFDKTSWVNEINKVV